MLRNLALCIILGTALLFYLYSSSLSLVFQFRIPLMAHTNTNTNAGCSSPFASWHTRALNILIPNPHTFTPTAESFVLAVLLNSQGEHEGMTLALFSNRDGAVIAVDTLGQVLQVPTKDSSGILALAKQVLELPDTSAFRNNRA